MKIIKITEQEPKEVILPDGIYIGIYGGYIITVKYDNKIYQLKTEEGIRGMGFNVVVTIKDNVATFEFAKN